MINTWSKFTYGTTIDGTNCNADFKEGASTLLATLSSSSRTLGEILSDLEDALNALSANNYVVSISRTTGLVTVAGDSNFTIPLLTGATVGTSLWILLGFSQGVDLSGAATYTGASKAASTYYPQFLLQSYVDPNDSQDALDPMVNRSASGRTELVRFGVDKFIEFELKFITDLTMDGVVIRNDPSGRAHAQAFLQDITTKSRFEFCPDLSTPTTFYKVICESTPGFKDGSGYKLKELFMQNLPGIFETGVIILRVVI